MFSFFFLIEKVMERAKGSQTNVGHIEGWSGPREEGCLQEEGERCSHLILCLQEECPSMLPDDMCLGRGVVV